MHHHTLFFYDLETSGLQPREARIMQFAGQRTTLDLEPLGSPVNLLVKITNDTLPSPSAINVTRITPQSTLLDGINEAEFCRYVTDKVFTPGTVSLGYNTVRFDDEFMRATFWRNFYDPYEWQWQNDRSRWDLLDVVRLTRALRPEGIKWPFRKDGVPTNRLELITKLNGVKHEHAHDALSDVYATIAVARLIREHQPDLYQYLFKMRDKRQIKSLVNLDHPQPFVYASGRYSNKFNKATVVFPISPSRNGNVLVYDLRHNLDEVLSARAELSAKSPSASSAQASPDDPCEHPPRIRQSMSFFPIVKELCYNKCPAVAPLGVLNKNSGWDKLSLTPELIKANLNTLLSHQEFIKQISTAAEFQPTFPPATEPETALYDSFVPKADLSTVAAVRNADTDRLRDFHPRFKDNRLPELLLHYKGRNFPESLSESEASVYETYRRSRLENQVPTFLAELDQITDSFLKEELLLYLQSLQ